METKAIDKIKIEIRCQLSCTNVRTGSRVFVSSWYAALKHAKATTATAILALGGPITTALNFLFLGKAPSLMDGVGMLLIVAGIAALDTIHPDDREIISGRISELLEMIEKEPKSVGWKLRARVGTKKKWYNDVEEVERAEHLM